MPPRSVCLNVFTSSLGNDIGLGKERDVSMEVREVDDKMEGVEETAERGRHDSVQGSPDDSIAATHSYNQSIANPASPSPSLIMDENLPKDSKSSSTVQPPVADQASSASGMTPTKCSTCANGPAPGFSLSRCSRCKSVFYCSKTCQKAAWRSHKFECEPSGSLRGFSPSSAMNTPDISTPASPVAHDSAEPAIMLNMSTGDAVSAQPATTGTHPPPENAETWQSKSAKYKPSFQIPNLSVLGVTLEDAYILYAHEHGGLPPQEVALAEYRAYIDAVNERVELPLELDDVNKEQLVRQMRPKLESFRDSSDSGHISVVGLDQQNETTAELRHINELVYGLDAPQRPRSR